MRCIRTAFFFRIQCEENVIFFFFFYEKITTNLLSTIDSRIDYRRAASVTVARTEIKYLIIIITNIIRVQQIGNNNAHVIHRHLRLK